MTKLDEIKKQCAPVFKSMGLQTNRNKRIWIDDNNFYVTFVELEPLYSEGFFINIGVSFLWLESILTGIHNYREENSRIIVNPLHPLPELLMYSSPMFESQFQLAIKNLEEKIQSFRTLKDLNVLSLRLTNRRDSFYCFHQDNYNEIDEDLGIVKMLMGDRKEAMDIFKNCLNDKKIVTLIEHCRDNFDFENYILNDINNNRAEYEKSYNFKLPIINSII